MVAGGPQRAGAPADDESCPICDARRWHLLTEIGPRSMASDWRVLDRPLRKRACAGCGVIANTQAGVPPAAFFERGYALYAHAPGRSTEAARQAAYASWITAAIGAAAPARVLDVGCGNGSLLRALRHHWPAATLMGCDPSVESVARGVEAGLRVWQGTAATIPSDARPDLVVSVNVIEHTRDPRAFLRSLASAVVPGGTLAVICPDASIPDTEVLVADHEWSFTTAHRDALFAAAGLAIRHAGAAPSLIGAFQLAIADVATAPVQPTTLPSPEPVLQRAESYLSQWALLDERLRPRLGAGSIVCFGAGETAGLLRAYAPRSWQQVSACTADAAQDGDRFGELRVQPLASIGRDAAVLLGVRPRDQRRLAERLAGRFDRVIAWYDLVEGH